MYTHQTQSPPSTTEWRLGVVMFVDSERGILTLRHRSGSCSYLEADPGLLGDLRTGGLVQALVEGTLVLTLRRL